MKESEPVSTIIFDFGGVLLDWNPRYLYRKLFQDDEEAMERFLDEVQFYKWNDKQDAGRPFNEAVEELSRQYPGYRDLIEAYDLRWRESIRGVIQPVKDILMILKRMDYSLVGFSNWSAEKFKLVRHEYRFMDWFETIIISGEVGFAKPDPRIFSLLLRKINQPAEECLLIDDTSRNIEVAQKLGFKTIHFQSPRQLASELGRNGIDFENIIWLD